MIGALIKGIVGYFSANTGHRIGTAVADLGAIAAITPAVIWLISHKDESAVCFTYGQLAIAGLFVFAVIKIAHYTRAGNPGNRGSAETLDFTDRR